MISGSADGQPLPDEMRKQMRRVCQGDEAWRRPHGFGVEAGAIGEASRDEISAKPIPIVRRSIPARAFQIDS
jgi:hypothetical protein